MTMHVIYSFWKVLFAFYLSRCVILATKITRIYTNEYVFVNESLSSKNLENYRLKVTGSGNSKSIPYDVFQITNGYFTFGNSYRFFYDSSLNLIESASGGYNTVFQQSMLNHLHAPQENVTLVGNYLYVRCSTHYWHFHYETLSQLNLYVKAGIFAAYEGQDNYAMFEGNCGGNLNREILDFYEFLSPLNEWKILKLSKTHTFGAFVHGNFITTTLTAGAGFLPIIPTARFIQGKVIEYYKKTTRFKPVDYSDTSYFHRRIFIGRDDKNTRAILNMNDVLPILQKYEIFLFNPGINASYTKQMYMFSHAELVIGVSGTGFSTNIAFCHANETILIEIIPPTPATITGRLVANALGTKFYSNFTETYNASDPTRHAKFYVNTTSLDKFIFDKLAEKR